MQFVENVHFAMEFVGSEKEKKKKEKLDILQYEGETSEKRECEKGCKRGKRNRERTGK